MHTSNELEMDLVGFGIWGLNFEVGTWSLRLGFGLGFGVRSPGLGVRSLEFHRLDAAAGGFTFGLGMLR